MWHSIAHTNSRVHTDISGVLPPIIPIGTASPPRNTWGSEPGWGWGGSLIGLLVTHAAEETVSGFSLQMTGSTHRGGPLGSNYYLEKGGNKAEREMGPTQIICSTGGMGKGFKEKTF